MENNYLSSADKSLQTALSNKKNLTEEEREKLDALNKKDAESTATLINACMGGNAGACSAAKQDALAKQESYKNLGYQNQKESQAGYQQIQQLLTGTSAEAKQTQALYDGMVKSYMRTGMSEEAAKSAVGYQLGAMYITGGIAGIGAGKAVDEGVTPGVKPVSPSAKPENINSGKGSIGTDKAVDEGGSPGVKPVSPSVKPENINSGKGSSQAETTPPNGAENSAIIPKLNAQLSAQEIANGHAFEKHVLQRGEFDSLGIRTRAQFKQYVENIINNPTDVRYYSDGRTVYLDSTTRTVVIRNPGKGESTAFRPDYDIGWNNYIKQLPAKKTPSMN